MQKVIILGACSGIAQCLQRELAASGKEMLLVARSPERLSALKRDLLVRGASQVLTCTVDLEDISQHSRLLQFAQEKFSGFDTALLAYGSMLDQEECQESAALSMQQLNTDFVSAAALLTLFAEYFESKKTGCIAAITSVAGDRGRRSNYVYGAAKGALSLFLQGLRSRLHPAGVRVITIKPGPVDTVMTAHLPRNKPFADPEQIAKDIYRALERRSPDVLYTPYYWRYIMGAVRSIPEPIFKRLNF
jgi:decaprenylphospho-beta-D-erythro-pentofuranosid-2-ulose 2-reductase